MKKHYEREDILTLKKHYEQEDILTLTPEDTSWMKTYIYAWRNIMNEDILTLTPEETLWTRRQSYSRLRLKNIINEDIHRLLTFTPEETSWTKTYIYAWRNIMNEKTYSRSRLKKHHKWRHTFTHEDIHDVHLRLKKHYEREDTLTFTPEERRSS